MFFRNRRNSSIIKYPVKHIEGQQYYKNAKINYSYSNIKYNTEFLKLLPKNYVF